MIAIKNIIRNLWAKTPAFLKNKYILAFLVFIIWIVIFDANNMGKRISLLKNRDQLQKEKLYYKAKIEKDSMKLEKLKTDKEEVEKYAREQYLMKKNNEDIYVIVEEEEEEDDE